MCLYRFDHFSISTRKDSFHKPGDFFLPDPVQQNKSLLRLLENQQGSGEQPECPLRPRIEYDMKEKAAQTRSFGFPPVLLNVFFFCTNRTFRDVIHLCSLITQQVSMQTKQTLPLTSKRRSSSNGSAESLTGGKMCRRVFATEKCQK